MATYNKGILGGICVSEIVEVIGEHQYHVLLLKPFKTPEFLSL